MYKKWSLKNKKTSLVEYNNIWMYIAVFMGFVVVCVIGYMAYQIVSTPDGQMHVAPEKQVPYMRPLSSDDRYRWTSNSKYTLVIYESLDCKFCRKLNIEIQKNIVSLKWKFNLIYRNAPLVDLEPLAAEKSLITECIYRERWTEKMYDFIYQIYTEYQLFHRDNTWVKNIAKKYVSSSQYLDTCMNDPIQKAKIADDIKKLTLDGVNSTPSIGIYYEWRLVWRYASGFYGTTRVMEYLANMQWNADQFWDGNLLEKIQWIPIQ